MTPQPPKAQPPTAPIDVEKPGVATVLERIASRNTAAATRITLSGNGRLAPATVTESKDRPRRLVFTWGIAGMSDGESVVTIDIAPRDGGCDFTLVHEMQPQWADFAPRVEQGWTTMLMALDKALG